MIKKSYYRGVQLIIPFIKHYGILNKYYQTKLLA